MGDLSLIIIWCGLVEAISRRIISKLDNHQADFRAGKEPRFGHQSSWEAKEGRCEVWPIYRPKPRKYNDLCGGCPELRGEGFFQIQAAAIILLTGHIGDE